MRLRSDLLTSKSPLFCSNLSCAPQRYCHAFPLMEDGIPFLHLSFNFRERERQREEREERERKERE